MVFSSSGKGASSSSGAPSSSSPASSPIPLRNNKPSLITIDYEQLQSGVRNAVSHVRQTCIRLGIKCCSPFVMIMVSIIRRIIIHVLSNLKLIEKIIPGFKVLDPQFVQEIIPLPKSLESLKGNIADCLDNPPLVPYRLLRKKKEKSRSKSDLRHQDGEDIGRPGTSMSGDASSVKSKKSRRFNSLAKLNCLKSNQDTTETNSSFDEDHDDDVVADHHEGDLHNVKTGRRFEGKDTNYNSISNPNINTTHF